MTLEMGILGGVFIAMGVLIAGMQRGRAKQDCETECKRHSKTAARAAWVLAGLCTVAGVAILAVPNLW
jgi:hypothetical protein